MYSDEIRALLRAMPFVPFTVYLPDGSSHHVPHSDFAMLTPDDYTLFVAAMSKPVERIQVAQISRVASMNDAGIAR